MTHVLYICFSEWKRRKRWKAHYSRQSHVDYLQYLHISGLYIGHDVTKWCLLCLPERPSVWHAPLRSVRCWNVPLFLLWSVLVVRLHVASGGCHLTISRFAFIHLLPFALTYTSKDDISRAHQIYLIDVVVRGNSW